MSDFWWAVIFVFVWIPLVLLWAFALVDVFTHKGLSGLAKVLWALLIVFLPVIGMLIYFVARPPRPEEWATSEYSSYAPGPSPSGGTVREMEALIQLKQQGAISDEEYTRLKDRVLGAT
jgi:hypothetical protein